MTITESVQQTRLRHLQLNLLRQKGWRYLRYLHLRDFVASLQTEIRTIGISGTGLGFAELAIAVEFPQLEFTLTDVVLPGRPNYWKAMDMTMRWNLRNVRFGVWDLLTAPPCKFDAVASTEVLEHIDKPTLAVRHQIEAARKAFYALTPYATTIENSDAEKRMLAFRTHEHFVCGYDTSFFDATIPNVSTFGVYWHQTGGLFRAELQELPPDMIDEQFDALKISANLDLEPRSPQHEKCMGIKAIARF